MVFLLLTLLATASAQQGADGNPHHWDRKRRCDQTYGQYNKATPKCGICEGVGGIPYGDANVDIHLATCTPITTNVSDPVHPYWGTQFTANHYNEVLIGPKTDPFCFNSFPSNSSKGKLCYRADSGRQVYDSVHAKALRYDLNVKTVVGNVTSTIVHQGINMWIINHLPWYAAGVHQCICTNVHQASDGSKSYMYPVQYNWTSQMFFIGREELGIEYTSVQNYTEVVDHWAFGPHHVWSTPGTGEIRRMWQPFNGLQVFSSKFNRSGVDESLFDDLPPKLCKKKGGAAIRIKCTDNGLPVPPSNTSVTAAVTAAVTASPVVPVSKDVKRAKQKKPSRPYRGETFDDMSNTLNRWLNRNKKITTTSCDQWTSEEIQRLQAMLYLIKDDSLNQIYQDADDNRQMRQSIQNIQHEWESLNALIASQENDAHRTSLARVQRDGHCHEVIMWYVHHLTEDVQKVLSADSKLHLPLLSDTLHSKACSGEKEDDEVEKGDDDEYAKAKQRVCAVYAEQVTCASCHSNVVPPGHDFLKSVYKN